MYQASGSDMPSLMPGLLASENPNAIARAATAPTGTGVGGLNPHQGLARRRMAVGLHADLMKASESMLPAGVKEAARMAQALKRAKGAAVPAASPAAATAAASRSRTEAGHGGAPAPPGGGSGLSGGGYMPLGFDAFWEAHRQQGGFTWQQTRDAQWGRLLHRPGGHQRAALDDLRERLLGAAANPSPNPSMGGAAPPGEAGSCWAVAAAREGEGEGGVRWAATRGAASGPQRRQHGDEVRHAPSERLFVIWRGGRAVCAAARHRSALPPAPFGGRVCRARRAHPERRRHRAPGRAPPPCPRRSPRLRRAGAHACVRALGL